MEVAVKRPQRWDQPFSPEMREVDVDHLLRMDPFSQIDAKLFPAGQSLRDLLRNDTRIIEYRPGDLVVREGDYGSSAFLILSGQVRVVLAGLSSESLGREPRQQSSWWNALWQLARNPRLPEVRRDKSPAVVSLDVGQQSEEEDCLTAVRNTLEGPRVFVQDVPLLIEGTENDTLGPGQLFGEYAALTRSQRPATVLAESDAVLVEIRWQGLRDLMRRTPALREHIEELYRQNSLRVHLRETPLLASLTSKQLDAVAEATLFESHGEFDWQDEYEQAIKGRRGDAVGREPLIVEEGQPSDGVLLVRSGFVRVSQRFGGGHRTIAYLGKGRAFGVAESVESYRSQQVVNQELSLRALGYVDLLRIPQEALETLVFPHLSQQEIDRWEADRLYKFGHCKCDSKLPESPCESKTNDTLKQGTLEFLVERRLINGQKAMAIDLDRCTRCDDCVRACAATHDNNPRFVRQGPRSGPIQITQACMHCVDPVCMIGCPTGAIGRDAATGVVRINDQTCIGCATCANSCPYDNIRMVEIRDRRGSVMIDQSTRQPIEKATKCDMCLDLPTGPACLAACPHDALVRIDLGNLGELSGWLDR
ncbi:cyclic nucleotide-binding domain-containing protein [Adhaeretor mobilis]|uniref:Electron transport protein HydN n=1 Tax=Adhaeretor mobilis TaxID=1930276 RepID=A0A517N0G9_9BACT|nr:cyclic nucleotide-binding domain-containing protein [Adhaeretor mobilis]QDT00632.1 Electron transport protein HydN [Adhaeretor mobilis]